MFPLTKVAFNFYYIRLLVVERFKSEFDTLKSCIKMLIAFQIPSCENETLLTHMSNAFYQ